MKKLAIVFSLLILAGAAYSVPLHSLQPRLSDQEPP